MKAIEVTGKIDAQGNLVLDEPIQRTTYPLQVRVIVLVRSIQKGKSAG
ncbi:hypothetical protein [Nostoc commune]|nr:hypothetical protein [Nostoc commune]